MKKLFIISNESIFKIKEEFYCDNLDMKSLPEGLNDSFEVTIIARKSKKNRSHKIVLKNINIFSNLFSYLKSLLKSVSEKNTIYLMILLALIGLLYKLYYKEHSLKQIIIGSIIALII